MKEIAHRAGKHHLRFAPGQRFTQYIGMKRHFKAVPILHHPRVPQPPRHPLRIAVQTPRTHFRAARDWIPGGGCPFDVGVFCHAL